MKVIDSITSSLLLSYTVSAFAPQSLRAQKQRQCSAAAPLHMSGDRAHTEKMLEDMMGDDWRTFRAKLVAQELADAQPEQDIRNAHRTMHQSDTAWRNGGNGGFFSGAMSFIKGNNNHNREQQNQQEQNANVQRDHLDMPNIDDSSLLACNDPFASAEDIPALLEPRVKIDSKRWAHQLPNVEPGCVLIANEKLGGVFHQTVVLIIDHDDVNGSTGLVINRPLEGTLMQISSATTSAERKGNLDKGLQMAFNAAKVSYGGPVMQDDYTVLHGWGEVEGSKKVAPGVFVGGSSELAFEARRSNFNPAHALFTKGHAAWVPNQLQREINRGVWYIASASSNFILRYAGAELKDGVDNPDDLWADILTAMGGHFPQIAQAFAGPGDKRMKKLP
eukprot:CAMPEP_0116020066 /NCGR_PEP_ID=MMETSP0321-20121206/9588_1 /TAXON_ID=163516 /ORGANISM="Leptocylindrus danicus var. danicus, Strain B650" /LENGTH=389 /DNA_ID=CAMNT_0003490711 /DNA_START=413 /DNA_END=1582 /DNA_ORIENTATION=-